MCDKKIQNLVKVALKNEDLFDYNIDVHGKTNKDDGYLGSITFVTVTGKTKAGVRRSLNLVIKSSKDSNILRKQLPVKEIFAKEIYIYDQVNTAFNTFQQERGVENLLDIVPHCYSTSVTEKSEFLVFENLKPKGYDLWDRKLPMTYDHLKLILQAYGKWHAFSFALKAERSEIFEKLIENNINLFSYFIERNKMFDLFFENYKKPRDETILEEGVLSKVIFSLDKVKYILTDMFFEDPTHQVILHGDCWTNNFMFQSQNDTNIPSNVRIIDWQCSSLGSPVFDLSYFIYACCDTGIYKDVKELLKIYYDSLSECLRQLGCDPDDIFSYDKLLEHWRKFSSYGLILSGFIMKFSLCDSDDAPDFAEGAEQGKEFLENFNFVIKNEEEYFERLRHNFIHYAQNLE